MDFDIKRSHISALSKVMADPKTAQLSHLQRIDLIAEVLGFENQAALMATLKAAEGKAPAATRAAEKKHQIVMVFGREFTSAIDSNEPIGVDAFGEVQVLDFNTQEEADCYLRGIYDGDGWERSMVMERSGPDMVPLEGSYIAGLAEDPNLALVDWHNAGADLEDDDPDDEPA